MFKFQALPIRMTSGCPPEVNNLGDNHLPPLAALLRLVCCFFSDLSHKQDIVYDVSCCLLKFSLCLTILCKFQRLLFTIQVDHLLVC